VKLNKPEYSLYTGDLKLKIPKFHHKVTRPATNPLEPKYNLPKVVEVPAPIPKFIRDNINYDVFIFQLIIIYRTLMVQNLKNCMCGPQEMPCL
jgi:hypothetical protein